MKPKFIINPAESALLCMHDACFVKYLGVTADVLFDFLFLVKKIKSTRSVTTIHKLFSFFQNYSSSVIKHQFLTSIYFFFDLTSSNLLNKFNMLFYFSRSLDFFTSTSILLIFIKILFHLFT